MLILFSPILQFIYFLFPLFIAFLPFSINILTSLYPSNFAMLMYSFISVLFLFFISSIISTYFSSKIIAFALLLISEFSNSSIFSSLSSGTETIPPIRFARCANGAWHKVKAESTHWYLFAIQYAGENEESRSEGKQSPKFRIYPQKCNPLNVRRMKNRTGISEAKKQDIAAEKHGNQVIIT